MRYTKKQRQDLQRQSAAAQCARCGRQLYPGASCWYINGVLLCKACLLEYSMGFFAPHREEAAS